MRGYDKVRKEYPGQFSGMTDEEVLDEVMASCPSDFGLEDAVSCGIGCTECCEDALEEDYPEEE